MKLNQLTRVVALGMAAVVTAATAQVANFPTRPLKIVVPTSPGSGSDTTARYFGEQLAAALGQPVVVDNKPGANGVLAAMVVKQAPADGYTLFLGTNTHMAVNAPRVPVIMSATMLKPRVKAIKVMRGEPFDCASR